MTYTTDEIRAMLDETKHLGDGQFPIPRNVAALAITQAEEIERLRELLTEARGDISTYVDQDYPADTCQQYPDIARRHFRDMELCRRIDAALKEPKP
jgi:hypothetical protein